MKKFPEFREACGVQAVLLGAAFVSGREVAFFFSGAGAYSWLGVGLAAVIFGLLTAMLARLARDTQAASLPGIYYAALGVRCGDALCVLHALTMLMTGAAALSTAGEMGALALDDPCASWLFVGMAMLLALIPALNGMRLIGLLGLIAVPACCLFFLAMALVFGESSYLLYRRIFSNPVTRFLSAISYNAYLWHTCLALKLKEWKIPNYLSENPASAGEMPWQLHYTLLCFFSALLLATALTFGFERPLTKKLTQKYEHRRCKQEKSSV